MGRHLVIMGLMGVGKSTLGEMLAEHFRVDFVDSDLEIEHATGRTVRQLADELGVDTMHSIEAHQLLEALERRESSVITAAASTIGDVACRRELKRPNVVTLWLRGTPELLAGRFGSRSHRPSFGTDPTALISGQLESRHAYYTQVRSVAVDVR